MPYFYEVIPGVLGRSVNFNITYRFLLRRPVFPDYPFLMTMIKVSNKTGKLCRANTVYNKLYFLSENCWNTLNYCLKMGLSKKYFCLKLPVLNSPLLFILVCSSQSHTFFFGRTYNNHSSHR